MTVDQAQVLPQPPPRRTDLIWETWYEPLVPQLASFARVLRKNQGPEVESTVPNVRFRGIPDGVSSRWTFPADLDERAPQGFEVEIDFQAEHPLGVTTLLLQWKGTALPKGYRVEFADRNHQYQDAWVHDLDPASIPFRENGYAALPVPVTLKQQGATVRYVNFVFPPGSLAGVEALEEIRFHFAWGPDEDDPTPEAQ